MVVRKRGGRKSKKGGNSSSLTLRAFYYLAVFLAGSLSTLVLQRRRTAIGTNNSGAGGALVGSPASSTTTTRGDGDCAISFGRYRGPQYSNAAQTVQGRGRCLVESKFLKVQQHSVQFPPAARGEKQPPPRIDDWLWIDYHDRINVLIEAPAADDSSGHQQQEEEEEPHFQIFQQTKYALEGRESLAIVGGIIEPGEQPATAARREVEEESGLDCAALEFLGRYRTDVNRGMGWTHCYVAKECVMREESKNNEKPDAAVVATSTAADEVGAADTERQDLKTLSLSQVRKAVQAGEFLEIQWTATVALAMLHYDDQKDGK